MRLSKHEPEIHKGAFVPSIFPHCTFVSGVDSWGRFLLRLHTGVQNYTFLLDMNDFSLQRC